MAFYYGPSVPLIQPGETAYFNRIHLMLSPDEFVQEDIPWPHEGFEDQEGFVFSVANGHYLPALANAPLLAIDCEMVRIN